MRQTRTIESFNRVIQYFNNDENVADLERRRGGFEHAAKYIDQATDYFLTQLNISAEGCAHNGARPNFRLFTNV